MRKRGSILLLWALFALSACSPKQKEASKPAATPPAVSTALVEVGSISVSQADLDHHLKEQQDGRREDALEELGSRAQMVQAALDEGLQHEPEVRAELARVLINRLKEKHLFPQLKAAAESEIPESRLRELYAANPARYQSNAKREVAVLWLNPNGNPEREKQYVEKLSAAREWFFQNGDLKDRPEQGFSTLGIDYSEHQASRYKNGVVGWMESAGGMDAWSKAVAEILFSLPEPGAVSDVIARPEGVFLVRYMADQPANVRTFESVADELGRSEKQRLRQTIESEYKLGLSTRYPLRLLQPQ